MSEYGLQVLMAIGIAVAFVLAAAVVRLVVFAIVSAAWPTGGMWTPPRSAGRR